MIFHSVLKLCTPAGNSHWCVMELVSTLKWELVLAVKWFNYTGLAKSTSIDGLEKLILTQMVQVAD